LAETYASARGFASIYSSIYRSGAVAILIKNPETERKARELASLRGQSITAAIDGALERAIAETQTKRRRPTADEIMAATERFRERIGLKLPQPPATKAEWDAINEIPGLAEDDD
jgi:hypothetical protein